MTDSTRASNGLLNGSEDPYIVDQTLGLRSPNPDLWRMRVVESWCVREDPLERRDNAELFLRLNISPHEPKDILSEPLFSKYLICVVLKPDKKDVEVLMLGELSELVSNNINDQVNKVTSWLEDANVTADIAAAIMGFTAMAASPYLGVPSLVLGTSKLIRKNFYKPSNADPSYGCIIETNKFTFRLGTTSTRAPIGLVDLYARLHIPKETSELSAEIELWGNNQRLEQCKPKAISVQDS